MGHSLRWEASLPKGPHLGFFQLLVLAALFHVSPGIDQVSKAVKDLAVLSCNYNISIDELTKVRIYWQKDDEVVLSIVSREVKVWPQYKNRTFSDITNNLSLVILALRLSDKGRYTCVIQKIENGSYKREHLISVILSVRADFPTPNITDFGYPSPDMKRIRCLTSGGFPKPHLSWLENGEELNAINTTVNQDPETELYAVSSELDFNVTYNHSFVCLIKYGDVTVSQTFNWQKPKEDPPNNHPLLSAYTLALAIGVAVAFTIIGFFLYYIFKRATRWRERKRKEETVEMRTSCIYKGPPEASG